MMCRTICRMGAAAAQAAATPSVRRAAAMSTGRTWTLADRLLRNDEFEVLRHDLHSEVDAGRRSVQAAALDDFFVPSRSEGVERAVMGDWEVAMAQERRPATAGAAMLDDFFLPTAPATASEALLRDSAVAPAREATGSVAAAMMDDFFMPETSAAVAELLLRDDEVRAPRGPRNAAAAVLGDCFVPLRGHCAAAHLEPASDVVRGTRPGAVADKLLADDFF